jgi:hypothetical protein
MDASQFTENWFGALDKMYLPPKAALSDSWLDVGMKRALQYAAENGYDGVTWAKSWQIARAVGAKPEALSADYDKKIPSWFQKTAKKYGAGSGDIIAGKPKEKSLMIGIVDYDKPLSEDAKYAIDRHYYDVDSALSEIKEYGNPEDIAELEDLKSWWDPRPRDGDDGILSQGWEYGQYLHIGHQSGA